MYFLVAFQIEGKSLASHPLGLISEWPFGHGDSWSIFIGNVFNWDRSAECRTNAETRSLGQ